MGYRALELVIQSAQGLRNVHLFQKMKPFALVSIRDKNNNLHSSEVQTPIDSEGGTNPKWNFHVTFNIDITRVKENHLALVVKLKASHITVHGERYVGEVRVLIAELEGFGDANAVAERHVSTNVVNMNGTSRQGEGTLNFSYKFGNTVQHPPASTVKIGNHATPNVQRCTDRRLVDKLTGELATIAVESEQTAVVMQNPFKFPFLEEISSLPLPQRTAECSLLVTPGKFTEKLEPQKSGETKEETNVEIQTTSQTKWSKQKQKEYIEDPSQFPFLEVESTLPLPQRAAECSLLVTPVTERLKETEEKGETKEETDVEIQTTSQTKWSKHEQKESIEDPSQLPFLEVESTLPLPQ